MNSLLLCLIECLSVRLSVIPLLSFTLCNSFLTLVVVVVVVVVKVVVVDNVVVVDVIVVNIIVVVVVVIVGDHEHVFNSPLICTYLRFPLTDFDQILM